MERKRKSCFLKTPEIRKGGASECQRRSPPRCPDLPGPVLPGGASLCGPALSSLPPHSMGIRRHTCMPAGCRRQQATCFQGDSGAEAGGPCGGGGRKHGSRSPFTPRPAHTACISQRWPRPPEPGKWTAACVRRSRLRESRANRTFQNFQCHTKNVLITYIQIRPFGGLTTCSPVSHLVPFAPSQVTVCFPRARTVCAAAQPPARPARGWCVRVAPTQSSRPLYRPVRFWAPVWAWGGVVLWRGFLPPCFQH